MQTFVAGQAIKISGLTYRQTDHVLRTGVLHLRGGNACGRGARRYFTEYDLLALRLARVILAAGHRVRPFRKALRRVQRGDGLPPLGQLAGMTVWTNGRDVAVLNGKTKRKPCTLPAAGLAYVLDLGDAARHVRRGIERMGAMNER